MAIPLTQASINAADPAVWVFLQTNAVPGGSVFDALLETEAEPDAGPDGGNAIASAAFQQVPLAREAMVEAQLPSLTPQVASPPEPQPEQRQLPFQPMQSAGQPRNLQRVTDSASDAFVAIFENQLKPATETHIAAPAPELAVAMGLASADAAAAASNEPVTPEALHIEDDVRIEDHVGGGKPSIASGSEKPETANPVATEDILQNGNLVIGEKAKIADAKSDEPANAISMRIESIRRDGERVIGIEPSAAPPQEAAEAASPDSTPKFATLARSATHIPALRVRAAAAYAEAAMLSEASGLEAARDSVPENNQDVAKMEAAPRLEVAVPQEPSQDPEPSYVIKTRSNPDPNESSADLARVFAAPVPNLPEVMGPQTKAVETELPSTVSANLQTASDDNSAPRPATKAAAAPARPQSTLPSNGYDAADARDNDAAPVTSERASAPVALPDAATVTTHASAQAELPNGAPEIGVDNPAPQFVAATPKLPAPDNSPASTRPAAATENSTFAIATAIPGGEAATIANPAASAMREAPEPRPQRAEAARPKSLPQRTEAFAEKEPGPGEETAQPSVARTEANPPVQRDTSTAEPRQAATAHTQLPPAHLSAPNSNPVTHASIDAQPATGIQPPAVADAGGEAPVHLELRTIAGLPHAAGMEALALRIAARSSAGENKFTIRLDPPELGGIEVQLHVDAKGKAEASLSADLPRTLDLLQRDAVFLERALKDAGLDLSGGLSFSLKSDGEPGGWRGAPDHTPMKQMEIAAVENANAATLTAAVCVVGDWGAAPRLDISV